MKQGVEISEGLRYKLRMMGVPLLDGSTHIKADNMSVINQEFQPPRVHADDEEYLNCIPLCARYERGQPQELFLLLPSMSLPRATWLTC
jgi:hypothetical protein